jgi:hypothetical protein
VAFLESSDPTRSTKAFSRLPAAAACSTTNQDPVIRAWTILKDTEWAYRLGQATDQQLHHARQAWQPHSIAPGRWAQPTITELRTRGGHDQADRIADLQRRTQAQRAFQARQHAEDAFDRLNPDFAVPADTHDPQGHHAVQQREAALALGTRAAVAITRENQPNPVVRLAGQDDRVAAAVRAARHAHARQGPERAGPER